MSDQTQTQIPTTTETPTTETTEAEATRKKRFTEELDLGGFESASVNLEEVKKAGRPEEVDYSPYIRLVEENYNTNKDRPRDDKISSGKRWKRGAVGVVRSRFSVAATRLHVGLNWIEKALDDDISDDGWVQLDFVAGERTYRPRKSKEDGNESEAAATPEESVAAVTEESAQVTP